jgi:hypothetical protein
MSKERKGPATEDARELWSDESARGEVSRGRAIVFVLVLPFLAAPAVGSAQIPDDTASLPQAPSLPDPIEVVGEIEKTVKDAVKATEEGGPVAEGGATGTQPDAGTTQGAGSSGALEGSIVTYCASMKSDALGVPAEIIERMPARLSTR